MIHLEAWYRESQDSFPRLEARIIRGDTSALSEWAILVSRTMAKDKSIEDLWEKSHPTWTAENYKRMETGVRIAKYYRFAHPPQAFPIKGRKVGLLVDAFNNSNTKFYLNKLSESFKAIQGESEYYFNHPDHALEIEETWVNLEKSYKRAVRVFMKLRNLMNELALWYDEVYFENAPTAAKHVYRFIDLSSKLTLDLKE